MTQVALVPNRARTDFLRVHHRDEDLPVLREVFLSDVYHLEHHADEIAGRVCIDVGANIGCVTLQMLDLGARHVIAIEPESHNAELFCTNIHDQRFANRFMLLSHAVGNPAHTPRLMTVGTGGSAFTAAHEGGVDVIDFTDVFRHAAVHLTDEDPNIAIMKVDVEGAEYDFIDTATADQLDRIDRIVMEFHGPNGCPHLPANTIDRYGALLTKLGETHSVQVFGRPDTGGMLYAHSYRI